MFRIIPILCSAAIASAVVATMILRRRSAVPSWNRSGHQIIASPDANPCLTISVIIPCFNTARFISRAVDSALAQTCQPLEVIVVDDASTDGLSSALAGYGDKIRIVSHDRNAGLSATRNTGIAAARGQVLAFLDADDWWPADFLQDVAPRVRPGTALCYDNVTVPESSLIKPDGSVESWSADTSVPAGARLLDDWRDHHGPARLHGQNLEAMFDVPSLFKIVVHRDDSARAGHFDERYFGIEDFHYFVKLLATGTVIDVVDAPVGMYLIRGDSILRTISGGDQKQLNGLKAKWRMFADLPREFVLSPAAVARCHKLRRYYRARYADERAKQLLRSRGIAALLGPSFLKSAVPALPGIMLFKADGVARRVKSLSRSILVRRRSDISA